MQGLNKYLSVVHLFRRIVRTCIIKYYNYKVPIMLSFK